MFCELFTGYPPTVNSYYKHTRWGVRLSDKGKTYRERLSKDVNEQLSGMETIACQVQVDIIGYVPDLRRRDIDNILKSLFDALSQAGVWVDDCQVDQLHVYRGAVDKANNGSLYVRISEAAPVIPLGMHHLLDNGE